jgi:hypothetical protein
MRAQLALLAIVAGGCSADMAAPASFVALPGGAHPLALPEHDRGRVEPQRRLSNLSFVFRLSPEQLRQRDALLEAQQDPASPSYRRWLTPAEYAARFGATAEDIATARSWLERQGFEVHETSPLGARVMFSGTVAQVQAAFHTELRWFDVNGARHFAPSAAPSLPPQLASRIAAVHGLHDFVASPQYQAPNTQVGFMPVDWADVYDASPLYSPGLGGRPITGAGATIAVVGTSQIAASDVAAFRTLLGLPPSTPTMTLVPNTGSAGLGKSETGFEGALDIEWAGAIATGATVNYVFTGKDDPNIDDAVFYAIDNNLGPVLADSYSQCERHTSVSDQDVLGIYASAANLLGITYVASAGDRGAAGCLSDGVKGLYTTLPAALPNVTAVGGTTFPQGALTGTPYFTSYSSAETVWNESSGALDFAGGGGISTIVSRPSFQSALATCAMVGSLPGAVDPTTMRMVPDVAFNAGLTTNPNFLECTVNGQPDCDPAGGNPTIFSLGGTSFGAPAFAGVVALLNQVSGGRLGNVNPLLYRVHQAAPAAFHDIATGSNEIRCTAADPGCSASNVYGFPAGTGYDCATGLGSVDVYNLAASVAAMALTSAALALNPTSTTEGGVVGLTATITVPQPNASSLTGTVTFAFQSYDQNSNLDLSWTLGTATITAGSTANGFATLATAIPPGLVKPGQQAVDVVAMYSGDTHHLPSVSAKTSLTFAPVAFAVSPTSATVDAGGSLQFTSSGGFSPIEWLIASDTTCSPAGSCSTLDAQTGAFVAGPQGGQVTVRALDNDGAEALASVTVIWVDAGTPDAGPPDAGTPDAGAPDAGSPDAGSPDAGSMNDAGTSNDAGSTNDAGMTSDAGATHDAGTGQPDAGQGGGSTGCGCQGASSSLLQGLWALSLFSLRRRRRA